MSTTELPLIPSTALAAKESSDRSAFWSALRQGVCGELRPDRLSRALYSTDASVYQIVPLGVVLPRTEEDVLATLKACARFGVPLTARGGGTSQAGQCIGPGVILDCSKYFNEILEINAAERWVRVRPGCVLDDLNQAMRPYGLQFAPDISTANRATIGGMIANNSSGTRSLIHGKTVDHVLELKVALADGSVLHMRPLTAVELEEKCARQDLEGQCYRTVRRLALEHADEIERRFPKILRRVGGYNLDLFVEPRRTGVPSPLSPWGRGVGGEGVSSFSPSPPTPLPRGERGANGFRRRGCGRACGPTRTTRSCGRGLPTI
jgi:FAD/FMN-containing dehydrogenase